MAAGPLYRVIFGDNLAVMRGLPDGLADLIYVDPPFNTGAQRRYTRLATTRVEVGDRTGFAGRRYATTAVSQASYDDTFEDYPAWLAPRLVEARRLLAESGSLYFHIDYREAHYAKVLLDRVFGGDAFLNEVIWAYDYGARTRRKWPPKHDTLLVYVKNPEAYYFDTAAVDRIPYMAPGLVAPEKAGRGKLPTDTWWHTIVPTRGKERLGYPTQKPLGILRRIVSAACPPGGLVLDFCAGSGTAGAAAFELDRRFILIDSSVQAMEIMAARFAGIPGLAWEGWRAPEAPGP